MKSIKFKIQLLKGKFIRLTRTTPYLIIGFSDIFKRLFNEGDILELTLSDAKKGARGNNKTSFVGYMEQSVIGHRLYMLVPQGKIIFYTSNNVQFRIKEGDRLNLTIIKVI